MLPYAAGAASHTGAAAGSAALELQLNHKGVVVAVNEHASKAVFGFQPSCLVGRPD